MFLGLLIIKICLASADVVHLERLDPRLAQIFPPEVTVEVVARDLRWAEGPLYLPDGRLIFADVKANRVAELENGEVKTLLTPSGHTGPEPYPGPEPGSSAMALDSKHRVVVAGHAGRTLWRFDRAGGPRAGEVARTELVRGYRGRPFNSPNDLVVAKDGAIYFTDPPFGLPSQKPGDPRQALDVAGIYRVSHPGEKTQKLELVSRALKGPNGLAFAPDFKTLYVADTPSRTWVKFSVGPGGKLNAPKIFARADGDARPGEPDGLKVDRGGNVFAAGPGGIWIFAADGTHLGTLPLPKKTSNLAWGGPGRRTLFITADDVIYALRAKTGANRPL